MNSIPAQSSDDALTILCGALLPVWSRQLATSRKQSESAVHEMLAAFAEIAPHLDITSSVIGPHVDRLYQGLQYQDRISQMMTLLLEDMQRLHAAITTPSIANATLAQGAWLARLESQYAMAEQRLDHICPTPNGSAANPAPETDFF